MELFVFSFCTTSPLDLFFFSTISPGEQGVEWTLFEKKNKWKENWEWSSPRVFSGLDCVILVIYEKDFDMSFLQLEGFLYIRFPPWGVQTLNFKELPNPSRLCLFPEVEREYRKDSVFSYLNEVFWSEIAFLTQAY
ncbi:hypothetical protein NP188_24775 [Salmonella enterica]|nr:hypothetical protein [Salmonella enterica]